MLRDRSCSTCHSYLSSFLAVPSPAQDVVAWFEVLRDQNSVGDDTCSPVTATLSLSAAIGTPPNKSSAVQNGNDVRNHSINADFDAKGMGYGMKNVRQSSSVLGARRWELNATRTRGAGRARTACFILEAEIVVIHTRDRVACPRTAFWTDALCVMFPYKFTIKSHISYFNFHCHSTNNNHSYLT